MQNNYYQVLFLFYPNIDDVLHNNIRK